MLEKPAYLLGDFIIEIGLAGSIGLYKIGCFGSGERWRSGAVVRASDFGPRGPWFEPRPVHISLWP